MSDTFENVKLDILLGVMAAIDKNYKKMPEPSASLHKMSPMNILMRTTIDSKSDSEERDITLNYLITLFGGEDNLKTAIQAEIVKSFVQRLQTEIKIPGWIPERHELHVRLVIKTPEVKGGLPTAYIRALLNLICTTIAPLEALTFGEPNVGDDRITIKLYFRRAEVRKHQALLMKIWNINYLPETETFSKEIHLSITWNCLLAVMWKEDKNDAVARYGEMKCPHCRFGVHSSKRDSECDDREAWVERNVVKNRQPGARTCSRCGSFIRGDAPRYAPEDFGECDCANLLCLACSLAQPY